MSEIGRAYDLLRGYVNHEWDRIRSIDIDKAWEELTTPTIGASEAKLTETIEEPRDPKLVACGILGIELEASFDEIKKAFDRLNKRSHPTNFPEGSEEAINASHIQVRVNWAYRVMTEDKSDSEMRFRSLEID